MNVLIVEDDPVAQEMIAECVAECGYDVVRATDGQEALDRIEDSRCRLVVCDWMMPEMNGVDLCRQVRRRQLDQYVYIILLTSRHETADVVEGLSAGADDFIRKPFEPQELTVRLRTGERVLSLGTQEFTIFTLAKLAESRDPETGQHLERVRNYARSLAQQLATISPFNQQIDEEFIRLLYQTTPLHDIGKVGIPDHVLLKPGRLDEREFEIMKTHARQGADTLEAALQRYPDADYLRMARDIAGCHHERVDGTGYPYGLAGDEIPLAARIFSIADVYDALVSKRVYKQAFSHDVARSIIHDGTGSQFDEDVVRAFTACEQDFEEIHRNCEDQEESAAFTPARSA